MAVRKDQTGRNCVAVARFGGRLAAPEHCRVTQGSRASQPELEDAIPGFFAANVESLRASAKELSTFAFTATSILMSGGRGV